MFVFSLPSSVEPLQFILEIYLFFFGRKYSFFAVHDKNNIVMYSTRQTRQPQIDMINCLTIVEAENYYISTNTRTHFKLWYRWLKIIYLLFLWLGVLFCSRFESAATNFQPCGKKPRLNSKNSSLTFYRILQVDCFSRNYIYNSHGKHRFKSDSIYTRKFLFICVFYIYVCFLFVWNFIFLCTTLFLMVLAV